MGAENFFTKSKGKTAKEAFSNAKKQAYYDHGHMGYTGSIAEKDSFVVIDVPAGEDPEDFADNLLNEDDDRVSDKWGPAGCIALPDQQYLFFGWASS